MLVASRIRRAKLSWMKGAGVCMRWGGGRSVVSRALSFLPIALSLCIQQPSPLTSRLQTTPCTNHSKFITQCPVPHHSTTRALTFPPHLAPRGLPKWKKKKVNPDPCSSSGRRGLSPGEVPLPQVPAGRRVDPFGPDSEAPGSNDRENMQVGARAEARVCGRGVGGKGTA